MYNLVRLLSPGVKSKFILNKQNKKHLFVFLLLISIGVAQQELLQYLEQGCLKEREEMLRLVGRLNANEQNSLKPVLLRLINEQLDVMRKQQHIQQCNSTSMQQRYSQESRSSLESWFGSDIYTNAYPRMPSGRVVSAYDLERSRLTQQHRHV